MAEPDLILRETSAPYPTVRGTIYVFFNPVHHDVPDFVIEGDSKGGGLVWAAGVSDLSNHGHNDLAVRGDNQAGPMPERFDYVDAWFGAAVFDTTAELRSQCADMGYSGVACFDVNGDQIDDLLWTKSDSVGGEGYASMLFGGPFFESEAESMRMQNPGVANFARPVIANAGDMNGDGYADIAVGADDATILAGLLFVFCGGSRIDEFFGGYRQATSSGRTRE